MTETGPSNDPQETETAFDLARVSRGSRGQSLADLLETVIDEGVMVNAEIRLSVADVDLVFLGLKAILCPMDVADELRAEAVGGGSRSRGNFADAVSRRRTAPGAGPEGEAPDDNPRGSVP